MVGPQNFWLYELMVKKSSNKDLNLIGSISKENSEEIGIYVTKYDRENCGSIESVAC
jgi:hypothetical protein